MEFWMFLFLAAVPAGFFGGYALTTSGLIRTQTYFVALYLAGFAVILVTMLQVGVDAFVGPVSLPQYLQVLPVALIRAIAISAASIAWFWLALKSKGYGDTPGKQWAAMDAVAAERREIGASETSKSLVLGFGISAVYLVMAIAIRRYL